MFIIEAKRGSEMREEAQQTPVDMEAIHDAIVMRRSLPEGVTRERLALELVLQNQSLTAASFIGTSRPDFPDGL